MAREEGPLHDLVCECIDRIESEGLAVVDELCRRHPEHETLLRSRIRALVDAGLLLAPVESETTEWPERLGDFRLLEPIGRGGMGVVFVAEQISVGRKVALKLVRPELLYFHGSRERFRREVDAVARLADPGIVPIYAVGEEKGIPFYAMELVEGPSLGDVVRELSGTPPAELEGRHLRTVLERFREGAPLTASSRERIFARSWPDVCVHLLVDVARAVDHAHGRGVVHRDLKPSNVLLTPHVRPVVVDFGLAVVGESGELTRTGSQLGSLPYMAPEQVRGDGSRLGPHTDVYALGVTLYELLALRLPHASGNAAELEREILAGRVQPLRDANPKVSRDLETVCSKALEVEPERRYASAEELARDLENVLQRRPVRARRVGWPGRARRWTSRHPAGAIAIGLACLLVAGGPLLWWTGSRRSRAFVESAANETALAEQHASVNLDLALDTLEFTLQRASPEKMSELPELLERALTTWDELAASGASAEVVEHSRARLEYFLGTTLLRLGRSSEARDAYRRFVDRFTELRAASPSELEWTFQLAAGLANLAVSFEQEGRDEEAIPVLERSQALLEPLASDPSLGRDTRSLLVLVEATRGKHYRTLGRYEEAEPPLRNAIARAEQLSAEGMQGSLLDDRWGLAIEWLAELLDLTGRPDEALELWPLAVERLEAALAGGGATADVTYRLGVLNLNWGSLLVRLERIDESEPPLQRAYQILHDVHAEYPEVVEYVRAVAEVESVSAHIHDLRGRKDEARADFDRAIETFGWSVEHGPDPSQHRRELAVGLHNRAEFRRMNGDLDGAISDLERAVAAIDTEGTLDGLAEVDRIKCTWPIVALAGVYLDAERVSDALPLLERVESGPRTHGQILRHMAELWVRAAAADPGLAASDGRWCEEHALDALRNAIELGWRDPEDLARSTCWDPIREAPDFQELLAIR